METSDYSFTDKLLHHLVLGVPFINKMSFDIDNLIANNSQENEDEHVNKKHIFISGLARSGTTILMRTLYETGHFRSLTYRDMPFVLMPNLWNKFSKSFHKQQEAKERAHGDGICVNSDSPEALEEVFWQAFSGDDYIFDNHLQPYEVDEELIEQFRLYIQRIITSSNNSNQQHYLSKNNNNILRLKAIRQAFPKAIIIIPFRDPIQHAISLLNQHQKFCDRHSVDKFSYHYMHWLGHYEFGMTHKPFQYDTKSDVVAKATQADDINYWLNIWVNTYTYLLNNSPVDSRFIAYETLCEYPVETLEPLFESANIDLDKQAVHETFNIIPTKDIGHFHIDDSLKSQAQALYRNLRTMMNV